MKQKIIELIYSTIDENSEILGAEIEKKESTVLYGFGSALDSMAMVTLVIALEQKINELYKKNLTLASEKAVSQKNSPFRNVETLANYIVELIENN